MKRLDSLFFSTSSLLLLQLVLLYFCTESPSNHATLFCRSRFLSFPKPKSQIQILPHHPPTLLVKHFCYLRERERERRKSEFLIVNLSIYLFSMEIIPEEEISEERVQGRQTKNNNNNKKKKSGLLFYSSLQYQQQQRQQMLLKASSTPAIARPVPTAEVKLAAIAVDLNIRLRSANMPVSMQERAFRFTRILVTNNSSTESSSSPATIPNNKNQPRINPTHIAHAIKKEFDASYGPAWHCIVGKSFGSFVTHSPGGFLYFTLDNNLSLLLFKTEVRPLIND